MEDLVLAEAKRLHDLGFAVHWLHPKSKRPIESGWTTGPRKGWEYLRQTYRKGWNVGTRLGSPSNIKGNFLGVIDVDVKSTDPKHQKEVARALGRLFSDLKVPIVQSGRGNGSRHYYVLTERPIRPAKLAMSEETIKVAMPSAKPSKRELEALSEAEIKQGMRLRPAWEIAAMGDGQQVVLPPSIHPDSGKLYAWKKPFDKPRADYKLDLSIIEKVTKEKTVKPDVEKPVKSVDNFSFEVVDPGLSWLPLDEKYKKMILTGEGVEDRSAMLLPIATALYKAELNRNEILNVLTDTENFIGACAYEHAQTKNRARAAYWVDKYTLTKVFKEHSAEGIFNEPVAEGESISEIDIKANEAELEKVKHWTEDLDCTDKGKYRATLKNVVLILKNNSPEKFLVRDLFSFRDYYTASTKWGSEKGSIVSDDDASRIRHWLGTHYSIEPSKEIIFDALTNLAIENQFDPIVDWLNSLPEWDQVDRLDTWLENHFEAKVSNLTGHREYLAQVFRKWIFGMVLRAFQPGAHFPWMPIFEGAQGIGKSSFGRLIVGEKYFGDWLPDLGDKDAALGLQGAWAVEMGELASMRKNEIEIVKAFLTRKIDKFRPPHGRKTIESARRCVFFGTTNSATYLKDDSGNRRFKPLEVGRLDFDQLKEDRDQLFAEALWLYRSGLENENTVELTGEALAFEKRIQANKMVADESDLMAEMIRDFYKDEIKKHSEERFNFSGFSLANLFMEKGPSLTYSAPLTKWRYDARNAQFASKALKNLGARKAHTKDGNVWFLEGL